MDITAAVSCSCVNMDASKLAEIKQRLIFNDRVVKAQVLFCSDLRVFISERSLYVVVRPSVVCLSSVTFVHPTQAIEIFGTVSMPFGTLAIRDLSVKILRRCPRGTPPPGELNTKGVAKYCNF